MDNLGQNSTLTLDNRKRLTLTGVSAVEGFSENQIKLAVCGDKLLIKGVSLKIVSFNKASGNFSCEGQVLELKYITHGAPIMKRIFK